jgi:hypothetical protein
MQFALQKTIADVSGKLSWREMPFDANKTRRPWRRMNGRYTAQRPLQTALTPPLLYYYTLLIEVSEHQYLSEQQSLANERYE